MPRFFSIAAFLVALTCCRGQTTGHETHEQRVPGQPLSLRAGAADSAQSIRKSAERAPRYDASYTAATQGKEQPDDAMDRDTKRADRAYHLIDNQPELANPREETEATDSDPEETIASKHTRLPLGKKDDSSSARTKPEVGGWPSMSGMAGSLAVVIGLLFLVVLLLKKVAPRGMSALPQEVFESLGRAGLTGKQQVHLLRCGGKLILVSVTPTGAETLTEITDPDEVQRIAASCLAEKSGSASSTFKNILSQFSKEPATGGFIGKGTDGLLGKDIMSESLASSSPKNRGRYDV